MHSLELFQGAVQARQLEPPLAVLVIVLLLSPSALALCVGRVCVRACARAHVLVACVCVRVCVYVCERVYACVE